MAFRWLFLVFLIAPQFAAANYSLPLTGTTTTGSIYAFPASVNGIQPALMSPWFLATSTRSSLFPFASTTAISAVSVCLTGDICRQTWPTGNAPGGTAGQLQYNASGSFGGVGTTTLTATSPLTGSFIQIGSGGALGCQTASGSQAGCLSSTDWNTFNGKQAGGFQISTTSSLSISQLAYYNSVTGTVLAGVSTTTLTISGFPAQIPSGYGKLVGGADTTFTYWGLSTSTTITTNQVLFSTSASGVSSVGTTTLTPSGFPINISGTLGGHIGGSNTTWTYWGLATSSNLTAGQILMSNGGQNVSSIGTTSETCNSPLSCTAHNVLAGGGAITISQANTTTNGYLTGTDWTTFNMKVATATNETTGQLAYWSTTSGSPPKLNSVATTTLTGSGVVSISNSPIVIGASGAVATITGGSNGQVLAWLAGAPAWAATSTNSCSGVTCTYNSGTWTFSIANNAITTGMLATLAANNVLGNNTGATGNVVAVATSTFFGADYPINSSGKTGIGSSSPWALFSINPVQQIGSAPSFAIGSSSGQIFNIDNTGAMNLFTNNATSTWNDKYGTTLMSLFTGSTTGPAFTVIATTSTPSLPVNLFSIDQYGHLMASSTPNTPTVSCSPSGGTLSANSNDTTGSITTGTLSVSCSLTFSRTYSQTPLVFVTQSGTASIFGVSSRSTTAFTVTLGTAATGDVLQYFVIMP